MITVTRRAVLAIVLCWSVTACGSGKDAASESQQEPERPAALQDARGYYAELAECLTEQGFPTTFDAQNIQMQVSVDSQEEAFATAEAHCQRTHGDPPEVPPFSQREMTSMYAQSVEAYHCLVREGYEPTEPPTLEVFIANYIGGPGTMPYLPHMKPPEVVQRDGGSPSWPADVCPIPALTD